MIPKPKNNYFTKLITMALALAVLPASIPAAETASLSEISDSPGARKLKHHDAALAIAPTAVRYQLRQNHRLTLVDVRSSKEFERLHIPGSINIPLYAIKTKSHLKSARLVLINEGFRYAELASACRRLAGRGFKASILDGGLAAWRRMGGQLTGDLLALDDMKPIPARVFYREKDYVSTLAVDISPTRSEASRRLMPDARHMPVLDEGGISAADASKLISQNKPFQTIIIFNETGEQYEKTENMLNRMGIGTFNLQGGLTGYQKYLEDLMLSWKPRDSRINRVGNCKPCKEDPELE
jgi:rhodanese-related sulfurtransferase